MSHHTYCLHTSYQRYIAKLRQPKTISQTAIAPSTLLRASDADPHIFSFTCQGDEAAQKKFQEVTEAYDTLKDSQRRQMYDQVGPDGMDGAGGFGGQGGFGVSCTSAKSAKNVLNCVSLIILYRLCTGKRDLPSHHSWRSMMLSVMHQHHMPMAVKPYNVCCIQ